MKKKNEGQENVPEGPRHPVLSEKIPKEMVATREIQPATELIALACRGD